MKCSRKQTRLGKSYSLFLFFPLFNLIRRRRPPPLCTVCSIFLSCTHSQGEEEEEEEKKLFFIPGATEEKEKGTLSFCSEKKKRGQKEKEMLGRRKGNRGKRKKEEEEEAAPPLFYSLFPLLSVSLPPRSASTSLRSSSFCPKIEIQFLFSSLCLSFPFLLSPLLVPPCWHCHLPFATRPPPPP